MDFHESSRAVSIQLLTLPGEIRNFIFEVCILDARRYRRGRDKHYSNFYLSNHPVIPLTVSVFPRWSGPGVLRLNHIGPLPLLFVNRQIHKELSSLVFSTVKRVAIGGYSIQRPDEDPNIRWSVMYPLMNRQPNLMKFTKKIKIRMPTMREDLYKGYWRSMNLKPPDMPTVKYGPWELVPGLEIFLRNFEQLSELTIEVTAAESGDPPDFAGLLPLCCLDGIKTTVYFVLPPPAGHFPRTGGRTIAPLQPIGIYYTRPNSNNARAWSEIWEKFLWKHRGFDGKVLQNELTNR